MPQGPWIKWKTTKCTKMHLLKNDHNLVQRGENESYKITTTCESPRHLELKNKQTKINPKENREGRTRVSLSSYPV